MSSSCRYKLEHGRRDQQRGADARRPGAAAEATGVAAADPYAADAEAYPAPPFRDVREARHAEQNQEERADKQAASHLAISHGPTSVTRLQLGIRASYCHNNGVFMHGPET